MTQALLDNHQPDRGFFYGIIGGRSLGIFDVVYEPSRRNPFFSATSPLPAIASSSRFGAVSGRAAKRPLTIPLAAFQTIASIPSSIPT